MIEVMSVDMIAEVIELRDYYYDHCHQRNGIPGLDKQGVQCLLQPVSPAPGNVEADISVKQKLQYIA